MNVIATYKKYELNMTDSQVHYHLNYIIAN